MPLECPSCGRFKGGGEEHRPEICPSCAEREELETEDGHARRQDRKRRPHMGMSGAGLRILKRYTPSKTK